MSRYRTARTLVAAMLAFFACGRPQVEPTGQVVLHVTTNAPLPPPPSVPLRPDEPTPLFHFLSFELVPPEASEACEGCANDVAIDRATVAEDRASVGLVYPPRTPGYRARVRLYRGSPSDRGRPRPGSTLESVVALPPLGETGIIHVSVTLRVEDLSAPRGTLEAPALPETTLPDTSLVGTWTGAQRVPCNDAPGPEEACVPGGAYWMGDPTLKSFEVFKLEGADERLIVLSPFFIDTHEVTVAGMRTDGASVIKHEGGKPVDPHALDAENPQCSYSEEKGSWELHPVNCISWETARAFCQAQGRDLPTEAQLEYLGGGLRNQPFVWGTDAPECVDVVAERNPTARDDRRTCIAQGIGHDEIGRGARDRIDLGGRVVVDLAGNLSEMARDVYSQTGRGFWHDGLYVDPIADVVTTQPLYHSVRGANYQVQRGLTRAGLRFLVATPAPIYGFRCARDDR